MQKLSTSIKKSSSLLKWSSAIVQQSNRFYHHNTIGQAECSTNGPAYPGATKAKLTHEFKFRSTMNEDGTPFPIFSIMNKDGEIVNEKSFSEIDVSLNPLESVRSNHHQSY